MFDVETSPEALQEDEIIIEAVEQIVTTASELVRTEIESEVIDMLKKLHYVVERAFPVVLLYQKDPSQISKDLEKCAIFLLVLLGAVVILAPWKRQRRSREAPRRAANWFLNRSTSASQIGSSNHWSETDEESDSQRIYFDDETDEERFEKMWPFISASYRKLVLPPTCRLVRVVGNNKSIPASPAAPNHNNSSSKKERVDNEEKEDPAARLQSYVQQLWYFIRSLISYDYTGAGWTLILWLQGIRRIQHHRRTSSADNDSHDGSEETNSVVMDSPNLNGLHAIEENQTAPDADEKSCDNGDDSIINNRTNAPQRSPLRETPFGSPLQQTPTTMGESNATTSTSHSPLHEEAVPPTLPFINKTDRPQRKDSVYYDPAGIALEGEHVPSEKLDRLVTKIRPRSLLLRSRSTDDSHLMETYERQRCFSESLTREKKGPCNRQTPATEPLTSLFESPAKQQPIVKAVPPVQQVLPRSPSRGSLRHFFDTANSRNSLAKMSVEVPVPDKNGFILGDDFLPDSSWYTPLLVFVNSRSGPQQGQLLITQLRRLLNPIQLWDLANGGPRQVLESFLVLSRLRILVCGGDGTVSWIINVLDEMKRDGKMTQKQFPPIAILPLGTGNDLARIHGWGGGYNNESLIAILEQISESYASLLDRWEVTIHDKKRRKTVVKGFFNYLGVGADAQAALQVHYLRESRPQWFFSRMVNKAMYGIFGAEDIIKASNVNVRREIKLIADGVEVPLPPDSQGIILLNIDAYAGGVPLWSHGVKQSFPAVPLHRGGGPRRTQSLSNFDAAALRHRHESSSPDACAADDLHDSFVSPEERFAHVTSCDMPSSCQDGYLDVVSIRGAFHLGQIKVGLSNAQRLCQCREASITIKNKVAVQVDGEPWRQGSCRLSIKRKKDPAVMLHRSADDGGVEHEMSKLLDWAEERSMIDSQVHSILMKEFSRRIESKTRQRRVKEQDNMLSALKRLGSMASLSGSQHHTWHSNSGVGGVDGGVAF